MNQSRFRSRTAWMAMVTLVLFVLKTYFKVEIPEADKLLELLLITGTAFGIWNNPEKGDKF